VVGDVVLSSMSDSGFHTPVDEDWQDIYTLGETLGEPADWSFEPFRTSSPAEVAVEETETEWLFNDKGEVSSEFAS
jgi:hypothetical protein